jgi:hypothetical protein
MLRFKFFIAFSFLWMIQSSAFSATQVLDLLPGDVIFSMNTQGGADHVGIFAGIGSDRRPYVLHSVIGAYHSLIKGVLKPIDTHYLVFRNKNLALAFSAYRRMSRWAHRGTPYDHSAAAFIQNVEEDPCWGKTAEIRIRAHYDYARSMSLPRFYRRIKYAARRAFPVLPKSDELGSSGRGLRCAESVVLCYQIEELSDLVGFVGDPQELGYVGHWVSDKYADEKYLSGEIGASLGGPSREYLEYQAGLRKESEYAIPNRKRIEERHVLFEPSICYWDFERHPSIEEFAKRFDTSLPIDSKVTSPSVLLYHLQQDRDHWSEQGVLDMGAAHPFSDEEKLQWRTKVQTQVGLARLFHDRIVDRIRAYSRGAVFEGSPEMAEIDLAALSGGKASPMGDRAEPRSISASPDFDFFNERAGSPVKGVRGPVGAGGGGGGGGGGCGAESE